MSKEKILEIQRSRTPEIFETELKEVSFRGNVLPEVVVETDFMKLSGGPQGWEGHCASRVRMDPTPQRSWIPYGLASPGVAASPEAMTMLIIRARDAHNLLIRNGFVITTRNGSHAKYVHRDYPRPVTLVGLNHKNQLLNIKGHLEVLLRGLRDGRPVAAIYAGASRQEARRG